MATVRVAQIPGARINIGEEEGRVRMIGGVFKQQVVHRFQKSLRIVGRDGALAAQVGLQIGHQERSRNAFSRNVGQYESQMA